MLPHAVTSVLHKLNTCGFEAYVVGGAVRDHLRGVLSDDWDIATNAHPEQVMTVFADHRVIPTGIQHGTVTIGYDDMMFEITTFRTDGEYSDGRHPDAVTFTTSLEADLARRDFTINAMAYHPQSGIIDPFGGECDLRAKQMRCVGDPMKRFEEDALRIARLLRFASVLSFDVDHDTALAADALCERFTLIAPERIRTELTKMLLGDAFTRTALTFHRPLCAMIPTLKPLYGQHQHTPYHDFDVYKHTMRAVGAAPKDIITRLALLFHDTGKPTTMTLDKNGVGHFYGHAAVSEQLSEQSMRALRFDNATIRAVVPLIHHHGSSLTNDRRLIKRRLRQLGEDGVRRLVDVKQCDACACKADSAKPDYADVKRTINDIIREKDCLDLKTLAVNGRDMLDLGVPPGPDVGKMLEWLLEEVINERLENNREMLIAKAKTRWSR